MKARPTGRARRSPREFDLLEGELGPVRYYKLLLQLFLRRREAGIRQAIADAIGKNRSFVSQLTSPAYDVPVPARYVGTMLAVARFTAGETRAFLDAYLTAHPDRAGELPADVGADGSADGRTRQIVLSVPALSDPAAQARLQLLIETMAQEIAATMVDLEKGLAGRAAGRGPDDEAAA